MLTGPTLIDAIRQEKSDPPSGIRTLGLDRTHRWLTDLSADGAATFQWDFDDAYLNLDGSVICSWIAALGDQALFFAASMVCAEGERTRMSAFTTTIFEDITAGPVVITAQIHRRAGFRLHGGCEFSVGDTLMCSVIAVLDVLAT